MQSLQLDTLGARETGPTTISLGVLFPWVTPANGQSVSARLIHERDQFLQRYPAVEVSLAHSVDPIYGDRWGGSVDVAATPPPGPGSAWGSPGRYLYRYVVTDPNRGDVDWVIDPFGREFGTGKQSAVTLGYTPYTWSDREAAWRTPEQADLVMCELNVAEFNVDLPRAAVMLPYLADLGVNCVSLMPLTNVAAQVDWGYLPIGYFGVDERFGRRSDLQAFVDAAHADGIAVIVDAVYGHASRALFPYQYLYDALAYHENPFMGPFAADMFNDQGASVDYRRPLVQDFYFTVNRFWLETFHVDGFRYDCVPNYWDGPEGVGYANLAYSTWQLVKSRLAAGDPDYRRFDGAEQPSLIQCAEYLDDARGVLSQSYSTSAWQDETLHAAEYCAQGGDGAVGRLGLALGLQGFPESVVINGETLPRIALQYIETHDHSRFLAQFGLVQPDDAADPLFLVADRSRWYKVQPYLIALLLAKGIPMLWEGQELAEDYTLPGNGLGRVGLLRPVTWQYFYEDAGRRLVELTRSLLATRRGRAELARGDHFYYPAPSHQSVGVMVFRRQLAGAATIIAVNFTDAHAAVPFVFPATGTWTEALHGERIQISSTNARMLLVPSNYGQVWTAT
jgi:maltooligosyltrehalose trehalohydrolase